MTLMEPTEIQEFSKQMHEASENTQLTRISLAISTLAVLVAMVTVLGHRTHTEAVLMQSRAGDQWNLYQAKKIREDNLAVVLDQMALQPTLSPAAQAKVAEYQAHMTKWKAELAEGQEKAQDYEKEVAHAESQAGRYDLGEALLQISVVLCSITLLTRKTAYFLFGLTLGLLGLLTAASALFIH
jgi:hypothetical protein